MATIAWARILSARSSVDGAAVAFTAFGMPYHLARNCECCSFTY